MPRAEHPTAPPPWQPGAATGSPPAAASSTGPPTGPDRATAVRVALGLGALGVVVAAAWWALSATAFGGGALDDRRCDTSLPDGTTTDLLVPTHALAALLLALAVGTLAAARPAGPGRTARLGLLGVVLLASLLMPVPALGGGVVLLGAAALGLVLVPVGVATAANLLLVGRRRTDVAHRRWPRRALAAEAVLWPLLISGPALSGVTANLTYADLFCF